MPFKIDGRPMTVEQFQKHVESLSFPSWKPSGIAVHNTANPSLYPLKNHGSWHGSSIKPAQRVQNLASYYSGLGWRSGPHIFVDDDFIWLFTPLNQPGTHSPSWNGTKIGIEMVGDYDFESFTEGPGAKVRANAVAALAILHAKLGIDPHTIKLHKEDPRTTHACPGKNVDKSDLIRRVINYMADAGDHPAHEDIGATPTPPATVPSVERVGVTTAADGLTLREFASASSASKGKLPKETVVTVLSESWNGDTKWYRVKTPSGYLGFVSAKYVDVGGAKKPKVDRKFIIDQMKDHGWSIAAAYGAAANAFNESSFDPDAVGDKGKAYGLFQWHGDRQAQFKAVCGKDIREGSATDQMTFLNWELHNSEKKAGDALKLARTAREAGEIFCKLFERASAPGQAEKRGILAQQWFDADKK
jgi:hypothetical protein